MNYLNRFSKKSMNLSFIYNWVICILTVQISTGILHFIILVFNLVQVAEHLFLCYFILRHLTKLKDEVLYTKS